MTTGGDEGGSLLQDKKHYFFLSRRDGGTRRPPDFGRLRNPAAVFSLFSVSLCDLCELERSGREITPLSFPAAPQHVYVYFFFI